MMDREPTNPYGHSVSFETTADIGLECHAKRMELLFAASAWALFDLMANPLYDFSELKHSVQITAGSMEDLFVDWLNELIYLFETEKTLFCRFEVKLDNLNLHADLWGYPVARHPESLTGVKAVTYHAFELRRDDTIKKVRFIVDI